MNELKPRKKKVKATKNITSSRRNYSPSGSIEKTGCTYRNVNEPFGYKDSQANLKMNTLRTKRHLSPKAKIGIT